MSDPLREAGERLLVAAHEYWTVAQRNAVPGAVVWLEGDDGRLVIFTRGEYRHTLLANIDGMGAPIYFDVRESDEDERP